MTLFKTESSEHSVLVSFLVYIRYHKTVQ